MAKRLRYIFEFVVLWCMLLFVRVLPLRFMPWIANRVGDLWYAIDATRIRDELGWRPAHTLEDGLRATVRWYLTHRDWCEAVQSGTYRRERLGLEGSTA